jgi:hypothetical protein
MFSKKTFVVSKNIFLNQIQYSTKKLQQQKFNLDQLRRTETEIFDKIYQDTKVDEFQRENLYLKKIYEENEPYDHLKEISEQESTETFYQKYDTNERAFWKHKIDSFDKHLDPGRKEGRKGSAPSMVVVHPQYTKMLEKKYGKLPQKPTEKDIRELKEFDASHPEFEGWRGFKLLDPFPHSRISLLEYTDEVEKTEWIMNNLGYLTKKQKASRRQRRTTRRIHHRRLENTIRAVAWQKKL